MTDNRNFINIEVNSETYRSLLDSGTMTGARIADMFKGRLRVSSTRLRTATSNKLQALGNLSIKIKIEAESDRIHFRVALFEQELILGMDFCKLFKINVRFGR